jgi:low affinity Fe/Cu permease
MFYDGGKEINMDKRLAWFAEISKWIQKRQGIRSFTIALLIIIIWGATGPLFDYSDTWQLLINTGTTIVTFLMVFLIQKTQNRDTQTMHLKLDELIRGRAHPRARRRAARDRRKTAREASAKVPFCLSRSGKPMKSFWQAFKAGFKDAGLEVITPHDMRRSAIRNFTKAGVGES